MRLQPIAVLAASLSLATAAAGCAAPYTHAAAAYAEANGASTDAISTTRATAADMCLKKARLRYLDGRLKEDARIHNWNDFLMEEKATSKLSWQDYCREIDKTAELFGLGVAALAEYGAALGALAKTGEYDGSNIKTMGEAAGTMATSLGAAEGPAGAIQPVGGIVGSLGALLFNAVSERKIKGYVIRADPLIQSLLKALIRYVEALNITLTTTSDLQKAVLKNAEKGMVTTPVDASKAVQFFQFASSLDDDARRAKDTLDGYVAVMKKMSEAHTRLTKASSDSATDDDAKNVLGAVADLLEHIKALRAAMAKKE